MVHTLHRDVHRTFAWAEVDAGSYMLGDAGKFAATWNQIVATCSCIVAMFYKYDSGWHINAVWKICADVLPDDMPAGMRDCISAFSFIPYTLLPEYAQRQHSVYRDIVVAHLVDSKK